MTESEHSASTSGHMIVAVCGTCGHEVDKTSPTNWFHVTNPADWNTNVRLETQLRGVRSERGVVVELLDGAQSRLSQVEAERDAAEQSLIKIRGLIDAEIEYYESTRLTEMGQHAYESFKLFAAKVARYTEIR